MTFDPRLCEEGPTCSGFELDVLVAEALAGFYHPFAYADRRPSCGPAVPTDSDLQLQG
jgi:hypothetical protein